MSDFKQLLSAVKGALSVISTVTSLPGVDLIPYVSTVSKVVGYAEMALDAGEKIEPYATALAETFAGGLPTKEQLDALDAKIEDLHAQIQAPLPAKEEGEDE